VTQRTPSVAHWPSIHLADIKDLNRPICKAKNDVQLARVHRIHAL
jgi:hypothetical protein